MSLLGTETGIYRDLESNLEVHCYFSTAKLTTVLNFHKQHVFAERALCIRTKSAN